MIDIHAHILPDIDDGPKTFDESIEMLQKAQADGIQAIVATPHTLDGVYSCTPEMVSERIDNLNTQIKKNNISMTVYPGMEIHICDDLHAQLEHQSLISLNNTRYVLIELPAQLIPPQFKDVVFQLRLKGYYPILAHPERNFAVQKHPEILNDFIEWGVFMQVTAASVTGFFGGRIKKLSQKMLQDRVVHFLASDAHSSDSRLPVLSEAYFICEKILKDKKEARKLVEDNPKKLIHNEPIQMNEPVRKKGLFRSWRIRKWGI
jgi:protein-tyrosine phosphatase